MNRRTFIKGAAAALGLMFSPIAITAAAKPVEASGITLEKLLRCRAIMEEMDKPCPDIIRIPVTQSFIDGWIAEYGALPAGVWLEEPEPLSES